MQVQFATPVGERPIVKASFKPATHPNDRVKVALMKKHIANTKIATLSRNTIGETNPFLLLQKIS